MKNRDVLRWSVHSKKLIFALFCVLVVPALHAEVSDDVWKALINQNVIIEKSDGSEIAGKLTSVADQVAVVTKTDGRVVSVPKEDVQNVRVSTVSETTAGEVSEDVWNALINQEVIIEKNDGSDVAGELAIVADQVVVVNKADGKVVLVQKKDVQRVRASTVNAPQRKTESASSLVSIHLAPTVSTRFAADDVAIRTGPAVIMSLIGRFPPVPWLIGSLAFLGEYHPVNYKGYDGYCFALAGYAQLGVLFDIVPAFSLGALFGPGYGYYSWQVGAPQSPGSGTGLFILGQIFGWYRISPSFSIGAEIGSGMIAPENGDRYFFAVDVGYHFSEQLGSAVQKAAPQPGNPQPAQQQQPSWLSVGAGAALDLTIWGDMKGNVSGLSAENKLEMKPIDIKAFVDLTYLQISAGYMFVNDVTRTVVSSGSTNTTDLKGSFTYASLAGYLKYPFRVGAVTVFPLLGVEYKLNLTVKDGSGNDVKSTMTSQEQADLNELWVEGGVGMDFTLGSFYIRPEVLIGFKPWSRTDKDNISAAQSSGWTSVSFDYYTINLNILVGFKL
jgi:small nuclear ribonucleoprotein (snRNP)-like protein